MIAHKKKICDFHSFIWNPRSFLLCLRLNVCEISLCLIVLADELLWITSIAFHVDAVYHRAELNFLGCKFLFHEKEICQHCVTHILNIYIYEKWKTYGAKKIYTELNKYMNTGAIREKNNSQRAFIHSFRRRANIAPVDFSIAFGEKKLTRTTLTFTLGFHLRSLAQFKELWLKLSHTDFHKTPLFAN